MRCMEKQGENIGVRMNEKLRKRNSSLWLELASLETEELKMFPDWLKAEAGVLISVTSDSWEREITIGDTRMAHGGTKHQSTKWSQGKTEQGNKPFDNPCELLRIELRICIWFGLLKMSYKLLFLRVH